MHLHGGEVRARFAEDGFATVRTMAKLALEDGCDFVVVAGDVFDWISELLLRAPGTADDHELCPCPSPPRGADP